MSTTRARNSRPHLAPVGRYLGRCPVRASQPSESRTGARLRSHTIVSEPALRHRRDDEQRAPQSLISLETGLSSACDRTTARLPSARLRSRSPSKTCRACSKRGDSAVVFVYGSWEPLMRRSSLRVPSQARQRSHEEVQDHSVSQLPMSTLSSKECAPHMVQTDLRLIISRNSTAPKPSSCRS